jgi:HNH endonuclease
MSRGRPLTRAQLLLENPKLEDRIRQHLTGHDDSDPSAHWAYKGRQALRWDYRKQIWIKLGGRGVHELVYRVMAALHIGDVPEGYEVAHKCQHPACVRPDHLAILSPKQHRTEDADFRRFTRGWKNVRVIVGNVSRHDTEH